MERDLQSRSISELRPQEKFSDLVGGWVGQNPRKARIPPPTPAKYHSVGPNFSHHKARVQAVGWFPLGTRKQGSRPFAAPTPPPPQQKGGRTESRPGTPPPPSKPSPSPCPSHTSLPWQHQWAGPRLPSYPPPSPGSACGRSHSCAPPSPLSSGACGRSHGCSPPLPLTSRSIVPPAEWPSGQPHELLSGSRGFDSLPSPCTPNTQHRNCSIGSCTTRNCILPACITYLPTSAIGYIALLPVLSVRAAPVGVPTAALLSSPPSTQ